MGLAYSEEERRSRMRNRCPRIRLRRPKPRPETVQDSPWNGYPEKMGRMVMAVAVIPSAAETKIPAAGESE